MAVTRRRVTLPEARVAVADCVLLTAACLLTYWLVTQVLTRVHAVSRDDDLHGGMWAVIATIVACRFSYADSVKAAVSRISASFVSFALCLIYLLILPFHIWALAALAGLSVLVVILIGRPGDAVTAGITATVVIGIAALSPHNAWQQPILRFIDTVVGVAVGVAAAWLGMRVIRQKALHEFQQGAHQPDSATQRGPAD
jgi:Fusaric acid resistance protein-like